MALGVDWSIYAPSTIMFLILLAYHILGRKIEKANEEIIKEQDEEIANLKRRLARWES
ncbi:hypothetical protein [Bacillus sp. AFS029533]|uniref:hypothetical protein n=1 Tax=Bacillus sp. AFS029533 TaxID=2033494 RepID=UPI0015D4CA2D|nr:hypothetical protein [Bacillus sp. AFS029533]